MKKGAGIVGGAIMGMFATGIAGIKLMQTKMTMEIKSPKSFEATCYAIEKVVPEFSEEGWGFPFAKWNFYDVFQKRSLVLKGIKNIMVYFVCNARLANKVINADSTMVGIMPCSWAVYEKDNGDVYIAKINIGLMSKIFKGDIKEMMQEVEKTEKKMFDKIFDLYI